MWKLMPAALVAVLSLSAQVTVFQHADVIDGSGGPVLRDATLIVAEGKIRLLAAGKANVPPSAQVVDLSGKTVIPGIINLHGHVGMTKGLAQGSAHYTRENVAANLLTYARYGVTTTTSMGTDLDLMVRIRDEQRRGHLSWSTGLHGIARIHDARRVSDACSRGEGRCSGSHQCCASPSLG